MGDSWQFRELFMSSLTAYSDACTIPMLTPGCPFYREDHGIATCGEECREILKGLGVDRPTRTLNVLDGLVLRLRKLASTPPELRDTPSGAFDDIRDELEQRDVSTGGVLRMGVAPSMALSVLRWVEATSEDASRRPWQQLYEACRTSIDLGEENYRDWFVTHVTEWFARLVESDLDGFMGWKAPPEALLSNLPPPCPEPEAQWIWDRFTVTRLNDWTTSSLVLEWDHSRGSAIGPCSERVLAARTVDPDVVAEAALGRLAERTLERSPAARDLSAEHFASKAARLLEAGDAAAAADIFTALALVNPTDGEALNNLGFCLSAIAPEQAIGPLNRAAALPMTNPALNIANRAFVHHLLGRDPEAIELMMGLAPGVSPAYVWLEEECRSFQLALMPLDAYVTQLRSHLVDRQPEPGTAEPDIPSLDE